MLQPSWSADAFVMKKVKNTVWWTYAIIDLNGEGIVGTQNFTKKN